MRPPADRAKRQELGRSRRRLVRRVDQAHWSAPADRADPVAILQNSNEERLRDLVPLKMGRMAASPFGFFRGAAPIMAADLAPLPTTGLQVQICGDAHAQNIGAFAAPDGHLVFDLNDFDETMRGPWEWDLKRLATSFVLAGREAGDSDAFCAGAVRTLVRSYREALERFSTMTALDLLRYEVRRHTRSGPVHAALGRAERATPLRAVGKLTEPGPGGWPRFHDQPPLLRHVGGKAAKAVIETLAPYRETLSPERRFVRDRYHPRDVAFKVVGTGSVGTRDYVVLCYGRGPEDPLVLQVKESLPSCYARYLSQTPPYPHQGRRVAEGQHLMQTASDPFLGWTSLDGRDFLVRQLSDHKARVNPAELRGAALAGYALVSGEILAKGHARTGDVDVIAGYCGASTKLDKAIARFALSYADQTVLDHGRFLEAIKKGRLKAVPDRRTSRR